MKRAALCVPPQPEYPWQAISAGLRDLGFEPDMRCPEDADVLVTWSPWVGSIRAMLQASFDARGAPVIVMENGWLNPIKGVPHFQVALDGWNGTGRFPVGPARRWDEWGLTVLPWLPPLLEGDLRQHALVIGQRGHPYDLRTAPPNWHKTVEINHDAVLRRDRGDDGPELGAQVAVAWALMLGRPVVRHGPNLMVSALASRPGEPLLRSPARLDVFRKLAWGQWNEDEIATGVPFARLLELDAVHP